MLLAPPFHVQEAREARMEAARLQGQLEELRWEMEELEAGRAVDRAELAHTRKLNSLLQEQVGRATCGVGGWVGPTAEHAAAAAEGV